MEKGGGQTISIKQIREVPLDVAERCDNDPTLSAVRELYFYKLFGQEFYTKHPKEVLLPDSNVIYKGDEYALLQRDDVNGLIEDDDGRTQVVKVQDLKPGFKKHTPGHRDSFFDVSGDHAIYAGQWIFMPARGKYQEEYQTKFELAVVCAILEGDRLQVYRAMDGTEVYVKDEDILPLSKDNQILLNSKKEFRRFKEAAAHNLPMKCQAFELGSTHARLCAGLFDNQDLKSIKRALSGKTNPGKVRFQKTVSQTGGGESTVKGDTKPEIEVGQRQIGLPKTVVPKTMEQVEAEEERTFYDEDDSGMGVGLVTIALVAAAIALAAG